MMCDSPTITHCIGELSDSDHDHQSLQVMRHYVKHSSKAVDVGAHGHLFCSALRFKTA